MTKNKQLCYERHRLKFWGSIYLLCTSIIIQFSLCLQCKSLYAVTRTLYTYNTNPHLCNASIAVTTTCGGKIEDACAFVDTDNESTPIPIIKNKNINLAFLFIATANFIFIINVERYYQNKSSRFILCNLGTAIILLHFLTNFNVIKMP